ncbi:MAG: serine/threonine protein kinase [Pirellulaceae bacterium]|nr:serine/threonine protein kinase [Pirellulaceae bacterium]
MKTFQRLGPYLIQRPLGSGGMGSVFQGVDETTGASAAVKVLSPALAADPSFRERFGAEIETLKKLKHPNIVELLGYGEEDGHLFYAMELVEGRTLQQELQSGRHFAWREAARIGVQICQALKHAHDRGIIHRDLKPANLLLAPEEQIKLADFGIAKLYGMNQLTVAGGVIGTADYMSPEQGEGKSVTARSDLYSLGSVLYALLAGRPPFASRTAAEVIHKLRYEEPLGVRRLAPDTPEEFELIVAQLLAKDPAKRIATALAVANRLKAMEHGLSIETRADARESHFSLSSDGDYKLAGEAEDQPTVLARHETRFVSPAERALDEQRDSLDAHRNPTVAMPPSDAARGSATGSTPSTTHFTTYDAAARERAALQESVEEHTPLWWKVAPVLVGAAVIAAGLWYVTRPLSGDALYDRIAAVAREGEGGDLAHVEREMDQFLTRFPDDSRREEVRALREELELFRLQRQYERRARLRSGTHSLRPIERAYVEATQLAITNPRSALVKLQALVDVFDGAELNTDDQRCLRLAREQIVQLQDRGQATSDDDVQLIQQRLDAADELAERDPAQAAAIRRGVVELYAEQPWAEPAVARARAALEKKGQD